ncbi:MAG: MAPEG family protein [Pseudomonadota bacterium]
MSTELTCTLLTALLAAGLWIPYVVGVNTNEFEGQADSFVRPPDQRLMPAWVHRAHRAHLNLLEQFLPFAIIVMIGHVAGATSAWFGYLAIAFFALRCLHAVGMISG